MFGQAQRGRHGPILGRAQSGRGRAGVCSGSAKSLGYFLGFLGGANAEVDGGAAAAPAVIDAETRPREPGQFRHCSGSLETTEERQQMVRRRQEFESAAPMNRHLAHVSVAATAASAASAAVADESVRFCVSGFCAFFRRWLMLVCLLVRLLPCFCLEGSD